jgi:hypothetical protein
LEREVRRRHARDQHRIGSAGNPRPECDRVARCERDDFPRIGCLVGVENEGPERFRWLGALDDAGEEIERRRARQRWARWAGAAGKGRRVEERDHRHMRWRRAVAAGSAGRKRENEFRYRFGGAARLRCMEAGEGETRGRRAVGRQNGRALSRASILGHEHAVSQRVEQMAIAGELLVEIAGEPVPRNEHVCFTAEAPPERGMLSAAGAAQ